MLTIASRITFVRIAQAQLKRSYGVIGDAGGAFSRKGTAQEEKFIHDHEVEVIKNLKERLLKEKVDLQKKIDEANVKLKEKGVEVPEEHHEVSPESLGYSSTGSGGGAFAYIITNVAKKKQLLKINTLDEGIKIISRI
jgi:hypothetical protein